MGTSRDKNSRELVILDMDNVIVRGQSQIQLLNYIYRRGHAGFPALARILGWYFLYRLGLVKNPARIAGYAFSFLNGQKVDKVEAIFTDFFDNILRKSIYPEIIPIIEEHREAGREIIIISSACDLVVKNIAGYLGISDFIATGLEKKNGTYSGRLAGGLVYGAEKAARLEGLKPCGTTWAYADHVSDLPLLESVDRPVAVNPCPRLRRAARAKNWPVLDFRPA